MTLSPAGPGRLAAALVEAARAELELTPKPGLVDRRDNGSHPDLSFELMSRSIDLLPEYFSELLQLAVRNGGPVDLSACVAAGQRAEARMTAAIGANAHRGYIFLSGLVLLASAHGQDLRSGVAALAARILQRSEKNGRPECLPESRGVDSASPSPPTHGAVLRQRLGVGGIHAEALAGLPSVFDHGLPALQHGLDTFGCATRARHYLMAALMTVVEDTTTVHRCGREGLRRLRRDGRRLQAMIENGDDHLGWLVTLNDEYRAMRLTMGGVADCMALTIALHGELGARG